MNNTLNTRVKRLIKDDLFEYGKVLLWIFGLMLFSLIINIVLNSEVNISEIAGAINIQIGNFELIIEAITLGIYIGGVAIFMMIAGITAGYELPQHVRFGIARHEYFKANVVSAIIVSILIIPLGFFINLILTTLVSSDSFLYNLINLADVGLLTISMYILYFITAFFVGYFIGMVFQRFGWIVGVIFVLILLTITGSLTWRFIPRIPIRIFSVGDISMIAPELLGPTLIVIAFFIAMGTYLLVKDTPVKVR